MENDNSKMNAIGKNKIIIVCISLVLIASIVFAVLAISNTPLLASGENSQILAEKNHQ